MGVDVNVGKMCIYNVSLNTQARPPSLLFLLDSFARPQITIIHLSILYFLTLFRLTAIHNV